MDVTEAIRSRKSIRGYKPTPVPSEVLREVLDIASRSPSSDNAQTWEITVVTGKVLDNIKWGNVEKLNSGATPAPEFNFDRLDGDYRQRQVEVAMQLYRLMGISREDRDKRRWWWERGFRFFDAPAPARQKQYPNQIPFFQQLALTD